MLPLSKKPLKSHRKTAVFDQKAAMTFSEFCVFCENSSILSPFADFCSLPPRIQAFVSSFSEFSRFSQQENSENQQFFPKETEELQLMRNLATNQDNFVEKWLWNKYVFMKKFEYFNEFLLYRDTKSSIEEAFADFFCRKRENLNKISRFRSFFANLQAFSIFFQ